MNVYRNLDALPVFLRAVVTIGTFDGVHTGHRQIISQLTGEAKKIGGQSVIITFDPHPRKIIGKEPGKIKLINTTGEKIELLEGSGIDHLVIVPFTESFSQLTAEEYICDFLVEKFHPHTIIIGYDHRFGRDRKGDYHLLEDLGETYHFRLIEIPAHVLNAVSVSSTRIREAISRSEIGIANQLLGYDFFFEGTVVEGNRLGRTIGFPTANIVVQNDEKLLPGDGVFAVTTELRSSSANDRTSELLGNRFPGMMNIGMRPTVNGSGRTIEVNLFDFEADLYGSSLRVYVHSYLRGEQKFNGLEALKVQLAKDRDMAIQRLKY
jgi:riboflavin kinase/FMN adenylyltransferase